MEDKAKFTVVNLKPKEEESFYYTVNFIDGNEHKVIADGFEVVPGFIMFYRALKDDSLEFIKGYNLNLIVEVEASA